MVERDATQRAAKYRPDNEGNTGGAGRGRRSMGDKLEAAYTSGVKGVVLGLAATRSLTFTCSLIVVRSKVHSLGAVPAYRRLTKKVSKGEAILLDGLHRHDL